MKTDEKKRAVGRPVKRRQDIVAFQITNFPATLKKRLIRAAAKERTNLNDVAVSTLAIEFGVAYFRTGAPSPVPPGESTDIMFRMPRALRRAIKNEAAKHDVPARDIVIEVLNRRHP